MFFRKSENKNKEVVRGELNGLLSGFLTRKRLQAVKSSIEGKNRICDIGCGIYCWEDIIPSETYYVGLDIERDIVTYNCAHFEHSFYTRNVEKEDLDDLDANFDLVIMLAMLEHFDHPAPVLKKVKKLLAPNGLIVLTTPHPYGNLILEFGAKLHIFSDDKHTHNQLMDKTMISEAAKDAGLKILKYKRFLFGLNQMALLSPEGF